MSFIEPKIRLGNKTYEQHELDKLRQHNKQRNAKRYNTNVRYDRDKEYSEFYQSRAWRNTRKQVLLRDKYMCQECLRNGVVNSKNKKERFYVHHIIELKDDWDKRLDMGNLETVCGRCHIAKHKDIQNKGRGRKTPLNSV